jgi:uncharacterized Zn finger protein
VRESIATKAVRYLAEARLTLERVDADGVRASARGDGVLYVVTWNASEGWACTCPARCDCAHLRAIRLVTVREASP